MFKVHILREPERCSAEDKSDDRRVLEKFENPGLVPRFRKETVFRCVRNAAEAHYEYRQDQNGDEHTENDTYRSDYAEFVEASEVCREKRKECGDCRETCEEERLDHFLLRVLQDFFNGCVFGEESLRRS